MKSRLVLILMGLTFLWSVMIGRAVYLQLVPDGRLQALQKRQFETVVTLHPRRGDVLDRNGHELAVSATSYSIFVDPKILEEPHRIARFLARELKLTPKQVEEKLRNHKKRFVWLARGLEKDVRDSIAAQKIRGIGFVEESKRIYPNERLLSSVLGFVGQEGQGLEGLEMKYNDNLEAAKKTVSFQRDARGRPLIVNGQVFNQVPDGADVVLTIDREVQFILEQELAQTVVKHEADSAVGVVLDAQTAEVIAMASAPSFDPNRPDKYPAAFKRNRAVTDSFEPGSTMKTFVLAGAIHKGLIQPDSQIDCDGGVIHIGKRTIHEADAKHKFNSLTVAQILQYSSNVGMTKVAFKIGAENVRDSLKMFGFGDRTGIDLPGEAKGIIQPFPWRDHLLANISFGHGFTATPIQIATAYAAIANGGYLRSPFVVKEIRDHENSEISVTKPKTIAKVLNDDDVAKLRRMLLAVTSKEGTGYNARVPGYPVAGKTGTAQKVNPNGRGYLPGGYISSFAGFIPANNPKYVIYIAVDHPRKEYYGAAVAAPVFSRVASFAVQRAGIAPVSNPGDPSLAPQAMPLVNIVQDGVEPSFDANERMPIDALLEMGKKNEDSVAAGFAAAAVAGTAQVVPPWKALSEALSSPELADQVAEPGAADGVGASAHVFANGGVKPGTGMGTGSGAAAIVSSTLSTDPSKIALGASLGVAGAADNRTESGLTVGDSVPDLTGLSLREVLSRVSGTKIDVRVHGQGFVTKSVPASGARLAGNRLTIYLAEPE